MPYDKKVDIFAAGVIFYILIGKRHPYKHLIQDSFRKYTERINYLHEDVKAPKFSKQFRDIPERLTKFIFSMIDLDPEKRCSKIDNKKGYMIVK